MSAAVGLKVGSSGVVQAGDVKARRLSQEQIRYRPVRWFATSGNQKPKREVKTSAAAEPGGINQLGAQIGNLMGQGQSKTESTSGFDKEAYIKERAAKDSLAKVAQEVAKEIGAPGVAPLIKKSWRTPATAIDPETIQVGPEFIAEEGVELGNGLRLGKLLGGGMQGEIFLLKDEAGKDAGRVYKNVKNKEVAGATGNLVGLEREWVVGRQLNTLREGDGFLPGYMQTGSKVVDADGGFTGMILEKLNGSDVINRFEDPHFNDIYYIREMSLQVLVALDRAQKNLGFKHRDMRVENIMEHRLMAPGQTVEDEIEEDEDPFGKRVDLHGLHFKIIDYGHAIVTVDEARDKELRRKISKYRKPPIPSWSLEWSYRLIFKERGDVWRFTRSLARTLEGRVWLKEDEGEVRQILALIRRITGLRVNAQFANTFEGGQVKKGPLQKLLSFGGRLFHIQWLHMTLRAYIFPGHPTITPSQALEYWYAMPTLGHGSGPKGPAVSEVGTPEERPQAEDQ